MSAPTLYPFTPTPAPAQTQSRHFRDFPLSHLGDHETVGVYRLFTGSEPTIIQHAAAAVAAFGRLRDVRYGGCCSDAHQHVELQLEADPLCYCSGVARVLRRVHHSSSDWGDQPLGQQPLPTVFERLFFTDGLDTFISLRLDGRVPPDFDLVVDKRTMRPGSPSRLTRRTDMSIEMKRLALASIIMYPLMSTTSGLGATGFLGVMEFMLTRASKTRLTFFIPKSSTSMAEPYQVVAVSIGILTFVFSVWQAVASRKRERRWSVRELSRTTAEILLSDSMNLNGLGMSLTAHRRSRSDRSSYKLSAR
ncbi:hypothetical protein ACJZ2D_012516 [Fusarium nematophilum]